MALTRVFEPIRIGPVEIPNRIVRLSHGTALSSPPTLIGGEDLLAYHLARAKGGVGLTILESMAVHPSSGALVMSDDRTVERYQELVAAVRPYGMRLFQQLFHQGHQRPAVGGDAPWAVSTVCSPYGTVGIPMTKSQIDEIVGAFAAAAARCRDGGIDGVEVHSAHAYLPAQFLSPQLNTRTDEYGGDLENRMRFLREVLQAIRAEVGDSVALGVRLAASEIPGHLPEDMLCSVIERLEQEGLIDFLTTSLGDQYRRVTIVEGMEEAAGYELPSARQLTAVATVPSVVTGRFRTLAEAEQVLADGAADLVSMVRALIADPDVVRKTREGRAEEVRPCIACNQGCYGGVSTGGRLGCTVNPAVGFERTLSEELITPAVESTQGARRRGRSRRTRGGASRGALRPRGHAGRGIAHARRRDRRRPPGAALRPARGHRRLARGRRRAGRRAS